MCFTCFVTNEVIKGKTRVSVPVLKRKVIYQKYLEKTERNGEKNLIFIGQPSNGWETVKEVFTTQDKEESLKSQYDNNYESETKKVMVRISSKEFSRQKEKEEEQSEQFGENRFF